MLLVVCFATLAAPFAAGCVLPSREQGANLAHCGNGVCECASGFAECDGDPSNGCETSLDTDPASCGACGHDCHGGACAHGLCQPATLWSTTELSALQMTLGAELLFWLEDTTWGGTAEPLPSTGLWAMHPSLEEPFLLVPAVGGSQLAAGGGAVCWQEFSANGDQCTIWLADLGGATRLLTTMLAGSCAWYGGIAVDDRAVHIVTSAGLTEIDTTTGAADLIVVGNFLNAHLLEIGTKLVWMTSAGDALHVFDLETRQQQTHPVADAEGYVHALAATDAYVFWADGYDTAVVRRLSLADGELQELASVGAPPGSMAADDRFVYLAQATSGTLVRVPVEGGPAETMLSQLDLPDWLWASRGSLFFMAGSSVLRVVP